MAEFKPVLAFLAAHHRRLAADHSRRRSDHEAAEIDGFGDEIAEWYSSCTKSSPIFFFSSSRRKLRDEGNRSLSSVSRLQFHSRRPVPRRMPLPGEARSGFASTRSMSAYPAGVPRMARRSGRSRWPPDGRARPRRSRTSQKSSPSATRCRSQVLMESRFRALRLPQSDRVAMSPGRSGRGCAEKLHRPSTTSMTAAWRPSANGWP